MKSKYSRRPLLTTLLIVLISIALVKCVDLESVDYPTSAEAGETITMTMHASFNPVEGRDNVRMIIGFLVPNSWNAADNTTMEYTSTYGDGTMSLVPEGTTAPNSDGAEWPEGIRNKFGIGGNLMDNVEWVVYQSDETYNINNGDEGSADIDITTRVGDQNMLIKLGFFIGNSIDGLRSDGDYANTNKASFTDCIEVTGGTGNIIDFCNPHLNAVTPSLALENDIVTFAYQGDIAENNLENEAPIYLCATGHTDRGNTYEICNPGSDKTRMTKVSEFQNNWELTIWPREYFDVGENETLTEIEYSFTNGDGSVELENEEISAPFSFLFTCE